jgi:hypothetical protein
MGMTFSASAQNNGRGPTSTASVRVLGTHATYSVTVSDNHLDFSQNGKAVSPLTVTINYN